MTRKLTFLDRLGTFVVAAVLVAGGLALIDWQLGLAFSWGEEISTTAVTDVTEAAWFSWAFAAAGIVIGVLGLMWLLSHVPRPAGTVVRTLAGTKDGRVQVDVTSVADAAASQLARLAPVAGASGTMRRLKGKDLVEIRANVDQHTDGPSIERAAAQVQRDVTASLPDRAPAVRVLLASSRRLTLPAPRRSGTTRLH